MCVTHTHTHTHAKLCVFLNQPNWQFLVKPAGNKTSFPFILFAVALQQVDSHAASSMRDNHNKAELVALVCEACFR